MKKTRNDVYDIIIQAGQSNSQGCGLGETAEEYTDREEVLYFTPEFTVEIAREDVYEWGKQNNFSLAFAREYVKADLKRGRKLLILRAAVGGTGFSDKRWGPEDDLYLRMMEMIRRALWQMTKNLTSSPHSTLHAPHSDITSQFSALNSQFNMGSRLIALLWHQGETDAVNGMSKELYYENLKWLVESVRNGFGCPKLPFIAGDFVSEWKNKNIKACEPIIAATRELCQNIGNAAFVETAGLKSNNEDHGNGDDIHFSRDALNILGKRYFEAYKTMLNNA